MFGLGTADCLGLKWLGFSAVRKDSRATLPGCDAADQKSADKVSTVRCSETWQSRCSFSSGA